MYYNSNPQNSQIHTCKWENKDIDLGACIHVHHENKKTPLKMYLTLAI